MRKIVLIFICICITTEIVSAATDKVVCYHGSWSTYRWGNGKFSVEDIDPSLCTHLIYSFVGLQDDGNIRHLDSGLDIDKANLKRLNALKQQNKNLKTLIAIGGFNEGSVKYSNVAADPLKRATLIKSALTLIQTWGFDGFDLDWEYPGQRGGAAADKQNYVLLIKEFRQEFDKHGLLLTAAVAATSGSVDLSYDVPSLSKYLDLINVMAYDIHGSWDGVTGQNAPLYSSSIDSSSYQKQLNVDAAIRGWIQRGADPQKIALGLGMYGRSYTLSNPSNHKLGAAISGAGTKGKYTQEPGMLGYNEIVELQNEGGWTIEWDDEQKNPFMYKDNQWVGFDNAKSIGIKVEYAKSLNLAGVMIWSIETDDFRGASGTKYPLLNTINKALSSTGASVAPQPEIKTQTEPAFTSKPVTSSTAAPISTGKICTKVGYVRDPVICSKFYYCLAYNGDYVPLELNCNNGLVFDPETVICNYPHLVQC